MSTPSPRIKLLPEKTYLSVIKNSVGSNLFRHLYAEVNGEQIDLLQDGSLSCALFVSSVLVLFKHLHDVHATVDSTVKDLLKSGWRSAKKPTDGCILVWQEKDFGLQTGRHKHIGFYIGNKRAISNSDSLGHPVEHDWVFKGRDLEMILLAPKTTVKIRSKE